MNVLQTITLNMQSNFQKWDIERMVILPIFHRDGFVTDIKEKL